MAKDTSSFDRDFGYLMPFLDRVAAAGAGLPPAARAELQKLVSGEKEKFQRIRELLAGAPAGDTRRPDGAVAPARAEAPRTASPRELPPPFTVGSLRGEPAPAGSPRQGSARTRRY